MAQRRTRDKKKKKTHLEWDLCLCVKCTCVIGDSEGDIVGDNCLDRPLRCSAPGDRVRGLMGAGRRRGELPDRRIDELMEGLLSDDWSWQLLRDAWMEGLLKEEDRPAKRKPNQIRLETYPTWNTRLYCVRREGGEDGEWGERERRGKKRADCPEPERGSEFPRRFGARPSWTVSDMRTRQHRQRGRSEKEQQWVWWDLWVNKPETERSLRELLIMYDLLA